MQNAAPINDLAEVFTQSQDIPTRPFLPAGHHIIVTGASGAGKSVFMGMLMTVQRAVAVQKKRDDLNLFYSGAWNMANQGVYIAPHHLIKFFNGSLRVDEHGDEDPKGELVPNRDGVIYIDELSALVSSYDRRGGKIGYSFETIINQARHLNLSIIGGNPSESGVSAVFIERMKSKIHITGYPDNEWTDATRCVGFYGMNDFVSARLEAMYPSLKALNADIVNHRGGVKAWAEMPWHKYEAAAKRAINKFRKDGKRPPRQLWRSCYEARGNHVIIALIETSAVNPNHPLVFETTWNCMHRWWHINETHSKPIIPISEQLKGEAVKTKARIDAEIYKITMRHKAAGTPDVYAAVYGECIENEFAPLRDLTLKQVKTRVNDLYSVAR